MSIGQKLAFISLICSICGLDTANAQEWKADTASAHGRASACAMVSDIGDQTLKLVASTEDRWGIALRDPTLNIEDGSLVSASLFADGRLIGQQDFAYVSATEGLIASLEPRSIQLLQFSNVLTISVYEPYWGSRSFPLVGASFAVQSLQECASALTALSVRSPRKGSTISRAGSPWEKNAWAKAKCAGLDKLENSFCATAAEMKVQQAFDQLPPGGQRWVRSSCPSASTTSFINACVDEAIEAMTRANWPVTTAENNTVCPRSLGPKWWRYCAESELEGSEGGAPVAQDYPSSKVDSAPNQLTTASPRDLRPSEIFSAVSPSIYLVAAGDGVRDGSMNIGSAVAVTSTDAITNCHVVQERTAIVLIDNSDRAYPGKISRIDADSDRCVLTVESGGLRPIRSVRSPTNLDVGEKVFSIGNPSGLINSFGEGLVSGVRRIKGIKHIQTTAQISHGSSGGALVDASGALVGITTFTISGTQGLNFAIAADEFKLGRLTR